MAKSSIFSEVPNTILGWPISETAQIIWCYLVPLLSSCFLYTFHFSTDLVLCYEHFLNDDYLFAILTFSLMCAPVLICLMFTLVTVEFWPKKGFVYLVGWAVIKVVQHLCFPVWAMYGYAERVFWSIEALRTEDEERELCLWRSIKTRPIELYFFFQAYLQSAPQILLQMHHILNTDEYIPDDLVNVQIISILMSLLNISKVSMYYQHYESQKLLGRHYPWSRKHGSYFVTEKVYEPVPAKDNIGFDTTDDLGPKYIDKSGEHFQLSEPQTSRQALEGLIEYTEEPTRFTIKADIHTTIPDDNSSSASNSSTTIEDNYDVVPIEPVREIIRIQTPDYPAPPPPPSELNIDAMNQTLDEKVLPRRKEPLQGRTQDDIIGKLAVFVIWLCFISARVLSISVLARFFRSLTINILIGHFVLTFIVILIYTHKTNSNIPLKNLDKLTQYFFLAYVYIFCLIEFRIKFKYFYRTYILYFVVIYTENVIMCVLWYLADWDESSWWYSYLLCMIIFAKITCVFFLAMYILILKPTKEIVYKVN